MEVSVMSERENAAVARFAEEHSMATTILLLVFILGTGGVGLWIADQVNPILGLVVLFFGMVGLQYFKGVTNDARQ